MTELKGWVELCAQTYALTGATQQQLADKFNRQRATIGKWARDPRYIARVAELRHEHFDKLRHSVAELASVARDALERALRDPDQPYGSLALQVLDKLGVLVTSGVDDEVASSPAREQINRKIIQAAERFRSSA